MKRKLLIWILIGLLLIPGIPSFSPAAQCQGDEWLDGWSYRKQVEVNQTAGTGEDYQCNLDLRWDLGSDYNSTVYLMAHSQLDFDDVRVTRSDGETLLPHYLSNVFSGLNSSLWFKLTGDLSSSNITTYLYYGNDDAADSSDADSTFIVAHDGLVLGSHFEETGGTDIKDGCGNDGSFVGSGGGLGVSGYHGLAMSCTGSGWASYEPIADYNFALDFTALAWVYHDGLSGGVGYPFQRNNATAGTWLEITSQGWQQAFMWINGSAYGIGYYISCSDHWEHLGVSYESGVIYKLVWDGGTTGSRTDIVGQIDNCEAAQLTCGAGFIAQIDDLLVFNKTLSDAEITVIMNNFGDAYIEPFYCMVRKWVDDPPAFGFGVEENWITRNAEDPAQRGEFIAAAVVGSFIFLALLLIIIFVVKRRR